jgi:predicted enzyme related to lactoylglutathione lyase
MADANVRGRFVWHELYTPNPAGAHEFYGKAVGWKAQAWDQDADYVMFLAPSGPVGAPVQSRGGTPQWVPYIATSNVDETTEAATRLGGRVETAATPLPNGGRYAILIDPQGARFGIHSSPAQQPDTPPAEGDFSWHELATTVAPGIAFGFYGALFDWDEISQFDMGPMGMYLIFGRKGRQLGGMFDKGAQGKPGSAYWLAYVSVTDLEGTVERVKGARGSVLMGPMDVPGGDRIAQLMDPHGAFFALHKAAGQAAAPQPAKAAARPGKKAAAKKPAAAKPPAKNRAAKTSPAKRLKAAARKPAKKKPAAKKKAAPKRRATAKPKKKAAKKAKKRGR